MDTKFLIFAFEKYYPTGGMNDCIGKASTKEEAIKIKNDQLDDDMFMGTIQVYDLEKDEII